MELETAEGWVSIRDLQSSQSWLEKHLSKRLKNRALEIFSLAKQKLWKTTQCLLSWQRHLFASKAYPFETKGKIDLEMSSSSLPLALATFTTLTSETPILVFPEIKIVTLGRLKGGEILLLPHKKEKYQICQYIHHVDFAVRAGEKVGCRHIQVGQHFESQWQVWTLSQMIQTQSAQVFTSFLD